MAQKKISGRRENILICKEVEKALYKIASENDVLSALLDISAQINILNGTIRDSYKNALKTKNWTIYQGLKALKEERIKEINKIINLYEERRKKDE